MTGAALARRENFSRSTLERTLAALPTALIVMPTYQEASSIDKVLAAVRAACDADVLVVDDNSPDGTGALAAAAGVNVLRRPGKSGLGSAYRDGFRWGLERGYDVLVSMDADLSHDPHVLPALIEATRDADLVIGSRYVNGGSTPDWPWRRRQLSVWANRYTSLMLRLPVRDATAGYRAIRAELLRTIALEDTRAEGYAFQVETVYRAVQAGATVREIPICFQDREHGKSKMSAKVIAESMLLVTLWGISRRLRRRGGA
jgi:dolichol-phosphate mannosyltransferase